MTIRRLDKGLGSLVASEENRRSRTSPVDGMPCGAIFALGPRRHARGDPTQRIERRCAHGLQQPIDTPPSRIKTGEHVRWLHILGQLQSTNSAPHFHSAPAHRPWLAGSNHWDELPVPVDGFEQ
jgi:hypothetical protein